NVEKVLERDQKLSELDDRADALQQGASQFEQSAGKLKNKFWLQNMKMMIMMGVVGLIFVLILGCKLVERYLMDGFQPQQLSTYALTLYRHRTVVDGEKVLIDFWDTAGQEIFQSMHASYYYQAHACILVFDATRKVTYKNLTNWYQEMRQYRPEIPCVCAVNKIDTNMEVTEKTFNFTEKHKVPMYYVSASNGTNVVKLFTDAISMAMKYKKNPTDFTDLVLDELERDEN
ncbi:unnamed protein product, partial [Notodromas monacha]